MKKLILAIALLFAASASFGVSAYAGTEIYQDNREEIDKEELPQAVTDAWDNSQYADYTIVAVYKVTSSDATGSTETTTGAETTGGTTTTGTGVTYEIEYTNNEGTRGAVTFNENGEMVQ